jgi:DNA-binding Xre family transcriptional regulator
MKIKVSYRWHLRALMATRGMFATSDLVPLLASRGVVLSREQVYRLVAGTPERLSLVTLAALCDIFDVTPAELIESVRDDTAVKNGATKTKPGAARSSAVAAETEVSGAEAAGTKVAVSVRELRPRRARVALAAR